MLVDVGSWVHGVIVQAVPVSAHHVLHPFQALNMKQDADYQVFVDFLAVLIPFKVCCCTIGGRS